ncbi:MAG: hypothetical protein NTU56_06140 [Proteobacteria bacterium]|nr:hypothetical protein [Pseudomonadota bacterium]
MLDPLAIAVPDDWYPVGNTSERPGTGPRKLSSSEIQHIKDELAGRFRTLFTNEDVLQFPNTVANSADFRHAVQAWAQRLRTGVDQMSGQSP